MSEKIWSDDAWEDYLYWQTQDKKTLKRNNQLIQDIERNGCIKGIGKPEPLSGDLQGEYSRRINEKDRLVYHMENGRLSTYISFTIPIVSSSRSRIVYRFMGNIFAPAFILTHQIFDTVPRHLFAVGIEHGYKPIIIRRRWHGIPLLYPDLIVAGSHLLAYTRTFSTMPNRKVFEKKVKNFQFSSSTIFDNAT